MTDHNDTGATARPWLVRQWSRDGDKSSGSIFSMPRDGHAYAVAMCPQYQSEERWNADAALIVEAVNAYEPLKARLAEVERERDEARSKLFPYADAKEISGMSWSGFNLIGDAKSVAELRRLENRSSQLEVFRAEYDRRVNAAEARTLAAEARVAEVERERDEAKKQFAKTWARALAAEARIAVLEKALDDVRELAEGLEYPINIHQAIDALFDILNIVNSAHPKARTALAEQKEAGK